MFPPEFDTSRPSIPKRIDLHYGIRSTDQWLYVSSANNAATETSRYECRS